MPSRQPPPNETASKRTVVALATSRAFHCIPSPPPYEKGRRPRLSRAGGGWTSPDRVNALLARRWNGCRGGQPGLCERPTRPCKSVAVPALELRQGDASARGVQEPAAADVDAGVVDLRRPGARPPEPEEHDVCRLELGEGDPFGTRDLAAHRIRRAPAEHVGEGAFAVVALELVDAPDEPRAVEAASRPDAERGLGALARAPPDVREADERERGGQDPLLPGREHGEGERRCG